MKSCSKTNQRRDLPRPGPAGVTARGLVSLLLFAGAWLAVQAGGPWWVVALPAGTFATLLLLAAFLRQPGCEVNLIWSRVLRKALIDCFLFRPIDRWEQRRTG